MGSSLVPAPAAPAAAVNPWMNLAIAAIPEVAALVTAVLSLQKQYPSLTPVDINAAVATITGQSDGSFDLLLKRIAADQAARQTTPVKT